MKSPSIIFSGIFILVFVGKKECLAAGQHIFCSYEKFEFTEDKNFNVSSLDPFLCTHYIYSLVMLDDHGLIELPESGINGDLNEFMLLKRKNKNLKLLLDVGGWDYSDRFYIVAASETLRSKFAKNIVYVATTYGFDGVHLHWFDYTLKYGKFSDENKELFSLLLKELRSKTAEKNLILTSYITSVDSQIVSYDIPTVAPLLDYLTLYIKATNDAYRTSARFRLLDIQNSIINLIVAGAPAEKIVLMIVDFNVNKYTLLDANNNYLGAATDSKLDEVHYSSVCPTELTDFKRVWDWQEAITYAFKNKEWIVYEDRNSLAVKLEFIMAMNLAGVLVEIHLDDYGNICREGKYPLVHHMKDIIENYDDSYKFIYTGSTSNIVTTPMPQADSRSLLPDPNKMTLDKEEVCTPTGFIRNPNECSTFHYCMKDKAGRFVPHRFSCPAGTVLDKTKYVCDYLIL